MLIFMGLFRRLKNKNTKNKGEDQTMINTLIKVALPIIIKQVSPIIKSEFYQLPMKFETMAKQTNNNVDDVFAVVFKVLFMVMEGKIEEAKITVNQSPDYIRNIFQNIITMLWQKAQQTENDIDNAIVKIIADIFNMKIANIG